MIVIPMAGVSRRFAEAGYDRPKYMLAAGGRSLFRHAVASFEKYFSSLPFLFVFRDVEGTDAFVRAECRDMGISDVRFVPLTHTTRGQAETVAIGLDRSDVGRDEAITIFNIDTIRPNFHFPHDPAIAGADGYLEVFRGSGSNWSFVRPAADDSSSVAETTEKRPVSDLCCTGLYHFRRSGDFHDAFDAAIAAANPEAGEYYVAPLYNRLIANGKDVRYFVVDRADVVFSGVPAEYEELKRIYDDAS